MQFTFKDLEDMRRAKGHLMLALIDPDKKNDNKILSILDKIHKLNFDILLIGGSFFHDTKSKKRIEKIKKNTDLPIILFPGSSSHISNQFNTMLYLNLISSRNPKYLIEEQVAGAAKINKHNISTIPTAYILLNSGKLSTVEKVSKSKGLSMRNHRFIINHALAGQYLGNKIIYFDCGSGSEKHIDLKLLKKVKSYIDIPIMVGGGIKSIKEINDIFDSGADYSVCSSMLEN